MPVRKRTEINLLPKTEFESSFWGRFLKWSLTSGRYIIILTELVVIVAFLSRFKLDKDLIDITRTIEGQQSLLEASSTIESTFKLTQARINEAGKILSTQPQPSKIIDEIVTRTPSGVYFISMDIAFDSQKIQIQGQATSETELGTLVRLLKSSALWKSIQLNNVVSTSTDLVSFSLEITM